jgi:alpha-tubulin suppressor-like RCC1 family protein
VPRVFVFTQVDGKGDGSGKWTRLFWVGLLTMLVLASVVPASASESSGAAAWGLNTDGQLGNGTTTTEKEAVAVKVLTEATAVAGGELHSLALLKTGKVMAWGLNNDGQLGNNTTTNEKEPVEVKGINEAVAIAAGADHSLALLKSGKVMAWGDNNDGQLGNNTTTTEKEPVEVKGITEAVAIAAGSDHSVAVLKSGKVMAWGDNNDGQLGNNTTTTEKEPVEVKKITEATAVAGGEFHSVALLKTGKVMAWGENNDGQLGNGTTTTEKEPVEVKVITEAISIAAGHNHSVAVLKSGKVMAWGDNNDGQLGNNTTTNEKEPVEVKGITEATAVAGGEFHSLALLTSGKVMAWGDNNDGQLGNGTTTTEKEPVEVKGLSGAVGGISAGANFSLASYATKPANTALPTISGEAKDEKTLTASTGTWTGSLPITYGYQWESCNTSGESCTNISGATNSTYAIAHEEVGHTIRVKVTAKNSAGEATATSAQTATVAASAPANTALPVISGKAEVGQLLSVSNGTWTGTPTIKYTYQWESCISKTCKAITGATESSYRVIGSQLSDTLRAVVTGENVAGKASADSAETATIAAGPPVNTTLPAISGKPEEGQTLSASTGAWAGTEPFTYTYQWTTCNSSGESCSNISGATSSTYKLTSSSVGQTLRIVVTAKNSVESTKATSSASSVVIAPSPPSNTGLPVISGTARDGITLSASTGTWTGTTPISYAYQWQSCNLAGEECHNIEGATSYTYTLTSANLETTLRVVVTASNEIASISATSADSAEVEPGAPSELEAPSITGTPNVDQTLHADAGTWGGTENETGYQWERCNSLGAECSTIVGETKAEYKPGEGDIETRLRVRVGVSNALGSLTAVSGTTEPIGPVATLLNTWAPSISGTSQYGHTLSANTGSWLGLTGITSYIYQWESCNSYGSGCEPVGEDTANYAPNATEIGRTIRVRVYAQEVEHEASETSPTSRPIAAENAPVSIAAPAVAGTGLKGNVLTATIGTWSGAGSITYNYQWERCNEDGESCSAISGATSSTYTLTESDVATTLRMVVTATDESGNTTAASNATAVISRATLVNVVAPSITGVHEIERALKANRGIWTGEGALTYTYKWERCNEKGESCSTIAGATESSYRAVSADVGKTLRVAVTAEGAAGKESVNSAGTPVIGSESLAPEDLFAPMIEGNLTLGETLTAQTGTWVSSETISYSYQWQTCTEEGECKNITGATSSTYKLIEGDIGLAMRVIVTAKNSLGTASATSEQTEVVGTAGPPANTSEPVINGTAKLGERLTLGNGSWSGSRPLSYYYRWERCNSAGESCISIEGATKPSYTVASADVSSTLRVKVTAKNSLSSAGSVSVQTNVVAGSETSPTPAIELAEKTDPSVLQAATVDTIEGQEVKPSLSDSGESLSGTTALTTSSVSKETPGEFAVNTPAGELSFQPVNSAPNATKTPTIVNGVAAVFAGTAGATDTIVRSDALGATTLLQLHSSSAPTSFSWELGLGPDQKLEKLSGGDVAVVEVPSTSPLEGSLGEGLASEASEATAEHEGSGESGEAAETTLEEGVSGESTLEKLSAAPTTSTPVVEPKSGELHPQETKVQYETAKSTIASAEEHAVGTTLMVIEPPKVMDAKGNTVSSSLAEQGDTITGTISPTGGTTWPVTAEFNIAAPSDVASAATASKIRYGLSDPKAASFEKAEEEAGKEEEPNFDKNLKDGRLHVGIARDVIYYRHPNMPELARWLEAVKKAELEPFITFGVEPAQMCHPHKHCSEPQIVSYEKDIKAIMEGVKSLYKANPAVIPPVTLWGAWNEPDLTTESEENPLAKDAKRAALFWKKARSVLGQVGCSCTMLAGEFAEDDGYIGEYAAVIQHNHSFGSAYPHVWGFHDYHDLENAYDDPHNSYAEAFLKKIGRRLKNPRIWFSEQGVALQNGEEPTQLAGNTEGENIQRQIAAAKDFLNLGSMHLAKEQSRVEVVDYYLYKGPSAGEFATNPHAFDSALLPGPGVTKEEELPAENPRPAYCVLALGLDGCPAKAVTQSEVKGSVTLQAGTVSLAINPDGLATKYLVEYGTTEAYGKTTTTTTLANPIGTQGVTTTFSGLTPCTTYHYQAEAENKVNEEEKKPGLGGDKTFKTLCNLHAVAVASGGSSACAVLPGGGVDCWGKNDQGQLGDGKEESSKLPVAVSGITDATAVAMAPAGESACALLADGSVDCWGMNWRGQLGDGTTTASSTPVAVSGISDATAITLSESNSCALLASGSVDCWGYNGGDELGTGEFSKEYSATSLEVPGIPKASAVSEGFFGCALSGGKITCWGPYESFIFGSGPVWPSPVTISGISSATAVSTTTTDVCTVMLEGSVDCWGNNDAGQLGDGTTKSTTEPGTVSGISNATAVATSIEHTCALLSTGHVDCWGGYSLGNGTEGESSTPVAVNGITTATAITAGVGWSCALLSDETVECWGDGKSTPEPIAVAE